MKYRYRTLITMSVLMCSATWVGAEVAAPSEPRSEHRRLEFFAGDWEFSGIMDGVQCGPGLANRVTETCDMIGGYFVACRYTLKIGDAVLSGIGITGYSAAAGVYEFTSYDSKGAIGRGKGGPKGETWSLSFGPKMRVMWKELSPTSYRILIEALRADGAWSPTTEGTYSKGK
jgi:Protein of unknown function (DUF1579)